MAGDKKKLAALTRMSALERELFDSSSAMAELLRGCVAAAQRKLSQCHAQRSLRQASHLQDPALR